MNINEFAEKVKRELEVRTGKEVIFNEVLKNNGVVLHGITFVEKGRNVSPTMYMENYLKKYDCEQDYEAILENILQDYKKAEVPAEIDMSWYGDFEIVKEKIGFRLVNFEKNKKLLRDVPYTKFLDMAIIFCVMVEDVGLGNGTILIRNKHAKLWRVNTEEIYEIAKENMEKNYPAQIISMESMIAELLDEELQGCEVSCEKLGMYIITNESKYYGAATICYGDEIKMFSKCMKSDVAILPSSVHELILLPLSEEQNVNDLKDMVYEVNTNNVSDEDVLSYSVYVYRQEQDCIEIF